MRLRLQSIFKSINSTVTIIIVVMGLLGLAATLVTGQIYHSLTLRSQMENIHQLLQQETTNSLQRVKQYTLQFSTLIINSDSFIRHVSNQSQANTLKHLGSLKQSPFLLSGVLNVKQINLYAMDEKLTGGVEFGEHAVNNTINPICTLAKSTSRISGSEQEMDISYDVCVKHQLPYLSSILPYSINQQHGLLELVVNLTPNLQQLEQQISLPVRLRLANQSIVFASGNWPKQPDKDSITSYEINTNIGNPVFYIDAIHQDPTLNTALHTARIWVISGAGISIALVILLAMLIMKKTLINPVNEVIRSIRMLRDDKNNLGAQVNSRGVREVIQLADDFNAMSSTLSHLYNTLETMAYTDALTRLGNRKLFHEKLEQVMSCAQSKDIKAALLVIDLDKFKQVNDAYGHQTGDKLLIAISNHFSHVLRNSDYLAKLTADDIASPVQDYVARVGGDEFAVILPVVVSEQDAIAVAKKLINIIQKPVLIDKREITVGLSIGIALFPEHAQNTTQLIQHADQAMYYAKKNNQDYRVYSPDCND